MIFQILLQYLPSKNSQIQGLMLLKSHFLSGLFLCGCILSFFMVILESVCFQGAVGNETTLNNF